LNQALIFWQKPIKKYTADNKKKLLKILILGSFFCKKILSLYFLRKKGIFLNSIKKISQNFLSFASESKGSV
jgi:hypothetical protein